MLQLTHGQLAAFAEAMLDDPLREEILRGLVESGHCGEEELREPGLRASLLEQIRLAARHGVLTLDGYVELLSYGFVFGHDWTQRPAVAALLDGKARAEEELLGALYRALSNPPR